MANKKFQDFTEKTHPVQDDILLIADSENENAIKKVRLYSIQQIFEASSQAEEDQIYVDHPNFPVQVIRTDLINQGPSSISPSPSASMSPSSSMSASESPSPSSSVSASISPSVSSSPSASQSPSSSVSPSSSLSISPSVSSSPSASQSPSASVSSSPSASQSPSPSVSSSPSASQSPSASVSSSPSASQSPSPSVSPSPSASQSPSSSPSASMSPSESSSLSPSPSASQSPSSSMSPSVSSSASSSISSSPSPSVESYSFSGSMDASPPSFFTAYQYGDTGIASLDGSGNMRLYSQTNDGAVMWRTNAVTLEQNKTYKIKMKIDANYTNYEIESEIGFFDATQKFSPNSDQSVYSLVRLMRFYFAIASGNFKFSLSYRNTSASIIYWDMVSSWVSTNTLSSVFTTNTEYTYIIITTPTQFKIQVKSSDEVTLLVDTSYVNWSSVATPVNSVWLGIGDFRTNAYKGRILINSYEET